MSATCSHFNDRLDAAPEPRTPDACEDCLATGGSWIHLRLCIECGHVGCCDDSPNKHGAAHYERTTHPLVRSYEPGENWWWCFADEMAFEIPGAEPAPSHA
ncbi:MAG: UBP-type zinc finger domain-containing protein [Mycobacteriales bacterium]